MKLVIVESPTKAKTISQFLGKDYHVESSYGHVRDLPKSRLGIDIEHDFIPQYVTPRKNQSVVTKLRKSAAKAEKLILATDEDREGEAIAWHLAQVLNPTKLSSVERIVFHEITKEAIEEALRNPRGINTNLVDAQQARRVLDRLVGYKLSPFLWRKVRSGLSAGRVQSVALRLIADREEEIKNFTPEEYWTIHALLEKNGGAFEATLSKINGEIVPKLGIATKVQAQEIAHDLAKTDYRVVSVEKREVQKNPLPPFTTSTLEQEATKRLGYSAKKTMFLAQNLYEKGHITYMRTDSVTLSQGSLAAAMNWIRDNLDAQYLPSAPRTFKTKSRLAQEAHEAIRPTDASQEPQKTKLERDQKNLYDLIWKRFIASQLPAARLSALRVDIEAKKAGVKNVYLLTATGTTLLFDGFLKIWPIKFEEKELPPLAQGENLTLREVKPEEHHTEPPPRYNEASLIKTFEKYGIGRPSTYAPIISVIQDRGYVEKQQGRFYPTDVGSLVNNVLKEHFPEIVDIQFTATMEEKLDDIAEGEENWQKVVRNFYNPFAKHLEGKYQEVSRKELTQEETDIVCEKCGKKMVIKFGRFGRFLACSGYPECKNTKPLKEPPKEIGMKCPKCLASPDPATRDAPGEVIERRVNKKGRARGKIFWGCSRYPECDYASWTNPLRREEEKSVPKKEKAKE